MEHHRPVRTRFWRNKRDGKVMGVCAGIADYVGMDPTMVRILFVASVFLSGGSTIPIYFIAGFMSDERPNDMLDNDADERRFWQGVRASPSRSAQEIRSRMREIDRRLADVEQMITTQNRALDHEIERLR